MNAIQKNVVSAALATMQRRNLPVGRLAQMKRICAVHGTAWAAQYRESNGLWRLERCVRPAYGVSNVGTQSDIVIDSNRIADGEPEICPWCGCGPKEIGGQPLFHVQCSGCRNHVCLGRTVGDNFRCCDRCGTSGRIGGYFSSYTASEIRNVARGGTLQSVNTKALATPARLQLTNGKRR